MNDSTNLLATHTSLVTSLEEVRATMVDTEYSLVPIATRFLERTCHHERTDLGSITFRTSERMPFISEHP